MRREFAVNRWRSNPFQLFGTFMLGLWSLLQLVVGVTKDTVFDTQIDEQAAQFVSATNLLGAIICLVGLHMRDLASALWIEVIGYISLIGSLCVYIWLVAQKTGPFNTAYGYGLAIAFAGASLIRSVQIFLFKRAERRAEALQKLVGDVLGGPDGG